GIASEGWPFVIASLAAALWLASGPSLAWATLPAAIFLFSVFKFRDPDREISSAFGVLSPVDGRVNGVACDEGGVRVLLDIAIFSPYLFRSPTEGKVLEPGRSNGNHGFRIRTDEGDDVTLRLHGPRWLPAHAVIDYGERVGQGQRCGMLRAARRAEILLPADAAVEVETGQRVTAGKTILGR